jgi:diadenylate cyclase
MGEWLRSLLDLETLRWRDALDILLVAVLVYVVLALLRRTRGVPVALGILAFVVIWRLAVTLELQTLGTILDVAVAALPLIIVLLFQNHIRRGLMAVGRLPMMRFLVRPEDDQLVEAIALAAMSMASQRIGALIVIERAVGLKTWIDTGVAVDARPSYELLMAIFHPRSPLHDGAVVLSGGRLAAASCLLPLTTKAKLSGRRMGSRHRAAIGLSEETDALIVVVSEERGTISLVHDGEAVARDAGSLRDDLARELLPSPATARRLRPRVPALR